MQRLQGLNFARTQVGDHFAQIVGMLRRDAESAETFVALHIGRCIDQRGDYAGVVHMRTHARKHVPVEQSRAALIIEIDVATPADEHHQ